MIEPMEPSGRWWRVDGHEVDVNSGSRYPMNVRAALLATRDATTPEGEDLAALLTWAVEVHSMWTGTCAVDGTVCETQEQARRLATEWLFTQAQVVHARVVARLAEAERGWVA